MLQLEEDAEKVITCAEYTFEYLTDNDLLSISYINYFFHLLIVLFILC